MIQFPQCCKKKKKPAYHSSANHTKASGARRLTLLITTGLGRPAFRVARLSHVIPVLLTPIK